MNRRVSSISISISTSVSFLVSVAALALALVPLMTSRGWAEELTHTKDTLDVVKARVEEKKAVLVDVRGDDEWKEGHLKSAVHVPLPDLSKMSESQLREKLPKDKIIYTHCAAGVRSLKAGKILEKFGYDIRPLKPGYEELVKAGFEVAK